MIALCTLRNAPVVVFLGAVLRAGLSSSVLLIGSSLLSISNWRLEALIAVCNFSPLVCLLPLWLQEGCNFTLLPSKTWEGLQAPRLSGLLPAIGVQPTNQSSIIQPWVYKAYEERLFIIAVLLIMGETAERDSHSCWSALCCGLRAVTSVIPLLSQPAAKHSECHGHSKPCKLCHLEHCSQKTEQACDFPEMFLGALYSVHCVLPCALGTLGYFALPFLCHSGYLINISERALCKKS